MSLRNKTNKDSNDGATSVHSGGSVGCGEQLYCMKRVYGDHVDEAYVFATMHTHKGPSKGQLVWANSLHEKVFDQYIKIAREKAILDGLISPDDAFTTRIPFHLKAWKDVVVSFSESEGKRIKRGDRIFEFGDHGKQLVNLPSSRCSRSPLCLSFSQISSAFDSENEKLRKEVSSIEEMMHQMMKREKERDQRKQ